MVASLESKTTSHKNNATSIHVSGRSQDTLLLLSEMHWQNMCKFSKNRKTKDISKLLESQAICRSAAMPYKWDAMEWSLSRTSHSYMRSDTRDRLI